MKLDFLQIAGIIAVFQSLFLGVLLMDRKKGGSLRDGLLWVLLISFAMLILSALFVTIPVFRTRHNLLFLFSQAGFCVGPAIYLYVKSLLVPDFKLSWWSILHLVPFLLPIGAGLLWVPLTQEFNIWMFPGRFYFSLAVIVQNLAYLFLMSRDLKRCGLSLRGFFTYLHDFKLAWVRMLIAGYILFWVIHLNTFIIWDVLRIISWCPYHNSLIALTAFIFFNALVYIAFRRSTRPPHAEKYHKSGLAKDDRIRYQKRLVDLMQKEKCYLDPLLNLIQVAKKMSIAPCSLSQIINESYHQNFRDFLNAFRIEESKRLLREIADKPQNILEIAYAVGFNSKSTFNAAFKKMTGVTPKEYKSRAAA